jgi:hypothetical protein
MRLENWSVVFSETDPYLAPELQKIALHGNVYGHPRFDDGSSVTTSTIKELRGELIITNSGSEYELGEVDPEYEKRYPEARQRIFKSLKK